MNQQVAGVRREIITKSSPNFGSLGPGVPNRKVAVARYKVPANTAIMLANGAQLVMKLADNAGNEISRDSYVYLYKKQSGFDGELFIAKIPYSTFFDLAVGDQRNDRYRDSTKVSFAVKRDAIFFGPDDELQIWVESPDAVDFTNAATLFELEVAAKQV